MTRQSTKDRELAILRTVYSSDQLGSVESHERPDFLVSLRRSNPLFFGVEVTEFYLSESVARLKNISGYMTEIFEHGSYRHRADREAIKIENVVHTRHGETEGRTLRGLVQRIPEVREQLRRIAVEIDHKGRTVRSGAKAAHVNLIILDHWNRWGNLGTDSVCRILVSAHVPRAVWRSPFREVFFVTEVLHHGWVYIPLAHLSLVEEVFMAQPVIAPLLGDSGDRQRAFLAAFGDHLARRTKLPVCTRSTGPEFEVLHRGYGLLLRPQWALVVRDYGDHGYPADSRPLDAPAGPSVARRDVIEGLWKRRHNYTFTMDVTHPVKGEPPEGAYKRAPTPLPE